jgi:hypothetical protein
LADLLTPLLVANPFSAVRASLLRWATDEFEKWPDVRLARLALAVAR